ncbi:MAG TPA: ATP-grasp domain-containing protein [Gaiellaceae bacterium]|nr:ATP-grasp domain-containing protein [Gaiellaceae bacterium]
MSSGPLRIALTYSVDLEFAPGDEAWLEPSCGLESVEAVEAACAESGWEIWRVVVDHDLAAAVDALEKRRPDVVFSMVESVNGDARLEAGMAYLLEWLGIPYTGAPPLALSLALHKPHARAMLRSAGVPVPRGSVLERFDASLDGLAYPVIVKPAREDGSMGISSASVAGAEDAARERVRYILEKFAQPAVVEEFVDGREFPVSLLGPTEDPDVLPLREIDYQLPPHLPRLLSYEAKWVTDSPEYGGTPAVAAPDVDGELGRQLRAIAQAAYRAMGLRDYGRVDIRLHPTAGPVVVDVNPNPELLPGDAGIAAAALEAGLSFVELIRFIVEQAVARGTPPRA